MEIPSDFTSEVFWSEFCLYQKNYFPVDFTKDKVSIYETIDSTNSELLRRLEDIGTLIDSNGQITELGKKIDKTLVAAGKQTAGRGRIGRRFYSPDRTGIYFSVIHLPKSVPFDPAKITAASAVAMCRAIENLFSVKAKIKWVNDIYVDEKKVCGILTEGFCSKSGDVQGVVIGIGINIAMEKSDDKNLSKAGGIIDMDAEKNPESYRAKLLAACVQELFYILDSGESFIDEYRSKSFLTGKIVKVTPLVGSEKDVFQAKVLDVTDSAGLLVQADDGTKKVLSSGEVTLH